MKIFPAIDIKDKKCVRLIKGDFENKTEYETSPVDQAAKYKDHGFKNLHIVDLDGALTGKTVNLDIIQEIVSKYDLKIEIGGGVRSLDSIKQYIDSGVEKVMGFCTDKEYINFLQTCPEFERMIISSGIQLIKYWFSVSPEEQIKRFQGRIDDPTKGWKLSPMDLESVNRWDEYSKAKDKMLEHTDTESSPWFLVESDNKKKARINCISHLFIVHITSVSIYNITCYY